HSPAWTRDSRTAQSPMPNEIIGKMAASVLFPFARLGDYPSPNITGFEVRFVIGAQPIISLSGDCQVCACGAAMRESRQHPTPHPRPHQPKLGCRGGGAVTSGSAGHA